MKDQEEEGEILDISSVGRREGRLFLVKGPVTANNLKAHMTIQHAYFD